MLKRLRKNHPLLYCIGAEAVFLGSLFVSSYLVVIRPAPVPLQLCLCG